MQAQRITPPQPHDNGKVMPRVIPRVLPQQPNIVEKSLQVNINSMDDARAAIQNLGKIKQAYELSNSRSVEFAIAEEVFEEASRLVTSVVNWCKTYVKKVSVFPGNTLFKLPHYVPGPLPAKRPQAVDAVPPPPVVPQTEIAKPIPASYRDGKPDRKPHVKPTALVPPSSAVT